MRTPQDTLPRRGPFGLWKGMSGSNIGAELTMIRPFVFIAERVPDPHPALRTYTLAIAPRGGLGWVKAVGPFIQTGAAGLELRSAFAALRAELAAHYGACETFDGPVGERLQCAPGAWMPALLVREQHLAAVWRTGAGSRMSDALQCVVLEARAATVSAGRLHLECHFNNGDAVDAESASWRIGRRPPPE